MYDPGTFHASIAQCVHCPEKAITFLGSTYSQLPFDTIIPFVQSRYRGDRQSRTFPNFDCRPYTAVYEPDQFVRPYSPVRLLHQQGDYIFMFSVPTATF